MLPGYAFLRNSIGVEQGNCMEFRVGGDETRVGDWFWKPTDRQWFWPIDGVVDKKAGVVLVSGMHNDEDLTQPHGFRWKHLYNEVMYLDAKSLMWRGSKRMPTYGGLQWGTTMLTSGDFVYIYAIDSHSRQTGAHRVSHVQDGVAGSSGTAQRGRRVLRR